MEKKHLDREHPLLQAPSCNCGSTPDGVRVLNTEFPYLVSIWVPSDCSEIGDIGMWHFRNATYEEVP